MIIWLIIICVASIAVIVGVIVLMKAKLSHDNKSKILLIIGVLIYTSMLISYFKQKRIFTFSLVSGRYENQFYNVFMGQLNEQIFLKHKNIPFYSNEQSNQQSNFYRRNYPSYPSLTPKIQINNLMSRQKIIFISHKNEGASIFLTKLASSLKSQSIPTLYIKLNEYRLINNENQLAQLFNLPNFEIFKEILQHYYDKSMQVYLIIDNPDKIIINVKNSAMLVQYSNILEYLIEEYRINVILNVQENNIAGNVEVVGNLLSLNQFQIVSWKNMDKQYVLYMVKKHGQNIQIGDEKLVKLINNYKMLNLVLDSQLQEQIAMRIRSMKTHVSSFYDLQDILKGINDDLDNKRLSELNHILIKQQTSRAKKLNDIKQIIKLGLCSLKNGQLNAI